MTRVTAIASKTTNRQSLVQGREYPLIGCDEACYRVLHECALPALYPRDFFLEEEVEIPSTWVCHQYSSEEYTWDPPEPARPGFYEDLADGDVDATRDFADYVSKLAAN